MIKVLHRMKEYDLVHDSLDRMAERLIPRMNCYPIQFDSKKYKLEVTSRYVNYESMYKSSCWGLLNKDEWLNFLKSETWSQKFDYEKFAKPNHENFSDTKKSYINFLVKTKAVILSKKKHHRGFCQVWAISTIS
jgi:hypothetical protein